MQPRIETFPETKLTGLKTELSYIKNTTVQLWQSFRPKVKSVLDKTDSSLYSVEIYPSDFFLNFDPARTFEKWAAVNFKAGEPDVEDLQTLIIPEGLYAVFIHDGPASAAASTYQFVFNSWIPESEYELDHRPHMAIMPENYRPDDPNAQEEIWIPIRKK